MHQRFSNYVLYYLISALCWKVIVLLLLMLMGFLERAYRTFCPPPPRLCGTSGGPPLVGPRIKLRDGRHLSYKDHGVPKEQANYKIIWFHGFSSNKNEASIAQSEIVEKLGIYFVSFDRPGYGESDPHAKRTLKSIALDVEELADELELGPKFYIIGKSLLKLAGDAMLAPVVNYWWPSFPPELATQAYNLQSVQDQWALRVAAYSPWLIYWWNTQKFFPGSSVLAGRQILTPPDHQVISKLTPPIVPHEEYSAQQGVHESYHRDMMVGFGKWEFVPMEVENPFPYGEGSVHPWHGTEDGVVPVSLQRYIAKEAASMDSIS